MSRRGRAKIELQEIIEFLKDPQKFTKLGGRLPKGALLVWPPEPQDASGTRVAVGGPALLLESGSDFVEMFVGVVPAACATCSSRVRRTPLHHLHRRDRRFWRHRGAGLGGGHDEREQTLNQLLVEMDGFESNEGVILIAATTDRCPRPALMRPARFDRQIVVASPTCAVARNPARPHPQQADG